MSRPSPRSIGAMLGGVALACLGRMLWRTWPEVRGLRLDPLPASLALLCYGSGLVLNAVLWQRTLRRLGAALELPVALRIWFSSQLLRYAPGSVLALLGRSYLSRREGVPARAVALSMAFEILQTVTAALLVGAATLPFWGRREPVGLLVLVLLPVLCGYARPSLFQWVIGLLSRRAGGGAEAPGDVRRDLLALLPGYCATWIANGAGTCLLARALYPVPASAAPALMGMFALAWTAGFLSVITPSGLGVREGVLGSLLALLVPLPVAVALALLTRVWLTLAELGCVAVVVGGGRLLASPDSPRIDGAIDL